MHYPYAPDEIPASFSYVDFSDRVCFGDSATPECGTSRTKHKGCRDSVVMLAM